MWRIALIGVGAFAGYQLAKMGKSRYNFIIATLTAAVAYKLTRDSMVRNGEIAAEEPSFIREIETEIV
jgi:hypothetical protein